MGINLRDYVKNIDYLFTDEEAEKILIETGYDVFRKESDNEKEVGCDIKMATRFSDGTICEYCNNLVLTKVGLEYVDNGKMFCCKECADDYRKEK